jgi:hypothetical protein
MNKHISAYHVTPQYFAIGVFFLCFYCGSAQAGFLDDLIKDTKENLEEAVENSKESIKQEAQAVADSAQDAVKGKVDKTVEDVNTTISEKVDTVMDSTVGALQGNRNRISKLQVEGIVVGSRASSAEDTLTKAGYVKLSAQPWLFQKSGNLLRFTAKNDMINSIALDGTATAGDSFIDQERARIETALGKACPPNQQSRTWLCNLEGDANEYYLELKVRQNKYSYLVEGEI